MTKNAGLTLIEALTTTAVIAVMAAMVLPALNNFIEKNRSKEAIASLHVIQLAQNTRYNATSYYYPASPGATVTGISDINTNLKTDVKPAYFNYTITRPASGSPYIVTATPLVGTKQYSIDNTGHVTE